MTHYTFPGDLEAFGVLRNGHGLFIDELGRVGIGTESGDYPLAVIGEMDISEYDIESPSLVHLNMRLTGTNAVGTKYPTALEILFFNEAVAEGVGHNDLFNTFHYLENRGSARNLYGTLNIFANNTEELCARAVGIHGNIINVGGGTITNAYGLYFGLEALHSNSNYTNAYCCYLFSHATLGAAIGTCYGLYIDDLAGSSKWGIYIKDGAPNYLAGKLGLGVVNPSAKLEIDGSVNLTSGNTYNINGVPHSHDVHKVGEIILTRTNTNPADLGIPGTWEAY